MTTGDPPLVPLPRPAEPLPAIELIHELRTIVSRHVRRTPLLRSEWLSSLTGSEVFLKLESLQITGSFKVRGALAAVSRLSEAKRARGLIAASAGNHGQGLAFAARLFDVPCTVVVPRNVADIKEAGMRARGARVIRSPHDGYDATQEWTFEHLEELGGTWVSPFDDPAVIAGNGGTLALEIFEEGGPEEGGPFDALVVPCGGGGCAIGMGIVAHARTPATRVVGVNTDASPGMWLSRRDGRPYLTVESAPTIADGIEGGVSERSYEWGKSSIDEVVLVREQTIRRAVAEIARHEHVIVEGAGAAGVAALLEGGVRGERLAVVLTGSNIDSARLRELLEE
ncbi:MAG: pyridoxal-phosphate dependent enzyme [Planctomycetota bacterium]